MADFPARISAGNIMWSSFPGFMGYCYFTSGGAYCLGMLVDYDTGERYNWFSRCNGWSCSTFGILLCNALVENTMAKLKYVSPASLDLTGSSWKPVFTNYYFLELIVCLTQLFIALSIKGLHFIFIYFLIVFV